VSLRGNSRAHWATKKRDADAYSEEVYFAYADPIDRETRIIAEWGWAHAAVTYTWCYAGAMPDLGNIPGNVKYLQDILCAAPVLGPKQTRKYRRWHLGLVENDRNIIPEYRLVKVQHRAEERVEITVTRISDS
jgi:hypothetical protein